MTSAFPTSQSPFFFQKISLPASDLDKFSASYSLLGLAPWLPRLTASAYFQRSGSTAAQPVPGAVPRAVTRILSCQRLPARDHSDTRQQVWTPGVDVQANFQRPAQQRSHGRRDDVLAIAARTSERRPRR